MLELLDDELEEDGKRNEARLPTERKPMLGVGEVQRSVRSVRCEEASERRSGRAKE